MTKTIQLNKTAVKDDYFEDLRGVLYWCYEMITDGDGSPDYPFKMMEEYGFIDENHEWIYDEDD